VAGVSVVEMAVTDESSRITRYLGCICAFLVFIWRYLNAPANWSYVGSFWSIADMVVTLLPEMIYPFVYSWAHKKERGEVKMKAE
jgi:hypothetical protein